jgi:hypothetical protein
METSDVFCLFAGVAPIEVVSASCDLTGDDGTRNVRIKAEATSQSIQVLLKDLVKLRITSCEDLETN